MTIELSDHANDDAKVLHAILDMSADASTAALIAHGDSNGRNRAHIAVAINGLAVRAAKDMLRGGRDLRRIKQAVELMRDVDSWTDGNIIEILDGCKAAAGLEAD